MLEALPEDVEAGHPRAPALLAYLAVLVQYRELQPRVGPAISGRPNDAANARRAYIELGHTRGIGDRSARFSREYLGGQPVRRDVRVDAGNEPIHPPLGVGNGGSQVRGEA